MNENIVSSLHVRMKLAQFGLICEDSKWQENGARVLGLDVHREQEPCNGGMELQFQKYPTS